jgi:hypothetical protein
LTYDLAAIDKISSDEVEKAFSDAQALTIAAGTDVAAIQATLKVYPGSSSSNAAGVLTVANKLASGTATIADVIGIVNPKVGLAYSQSRSLLDTVAKSLTGEATNVIRATGQFTLAAEDAADAVLRGEITAVKAEDSTHTDSKQEFVKDANGKTVLDANGRMIQRTITWMVYDRKVSIDFSYGVERANGTPIGSKQAKFGEAEDHSNEKNNNEGKNDLKDFLALVQSIPALKLGSLSREVASYETTEAVSLESLEQEVAKDKAQRARIGSRQTTENRTLEPLEDQHKAFKARFKEADELAKQNNYLGARSAYGSVYKESGSFAAGYNEAIMAEAAGSLEEAVSLMSALYDATKDSKAQSELTRLQRDLREKQALEKLL